MFKNPLPIEEMNKILKEEKILFKSKISAFSKTTPYYVYFLCLPNGDPFYVGKGKGMRAWSHLESFIKNPQKQSLSLKDKQIKTLLEYNEYPIMFIHQGNLSEPESFSVERHFINYYGRSYNNTGTLSNIISGEWEFGSSEISSYAGKIGGLKTKENKSGIFSNEYDRSAETSRRWEEGIIVSPNRPENYFADLGKITAKSGKGIFHKDYDRSQASKETWDNMSDEDREKRVESNRKNSAIGGQKSKELGTNFTSWDRDKHLATCSKGGSAAGKIQMWTDGIKNTRSHTCPGEGWRKGFITKRSKTKKENK